MKGPGPRRAHTGRLPPSLGFGGSTSHPWLKPWKAPPFSHGLQQKPAQRPAHLASSRQLLPGLALTPAGKALCPCHLSGALCAENKYPERPWLLLTEGLLPAPLQPRPSARQDGTGQEHVRTGERVWDPDWTHSPGLALHPTCVTVVGDCDPCCRIERPSPRWLAGQD